MYIGYCDKMEVTLWTLITSHMLVFIGGIGFVVILAWFGSCKNENI